MKRTFSVACFSAAMLVAPAAWSAIVYVDATPNTNGVDGNTTVNGNLVTLGTNVETGSSTGSGTNGNWHYRTITEAASGFLWETDTSNTAGEATAPLVTTFALAPGTYNLFGLYRPQAATHDVSFSLNGVDFTVFTTGNSTAAAGDGSDFVNPGDLGTIDHSIGDIYIASIGQVTFASPTNVSISAQGPDLNLGGNNSGQRTRYEGVGYELVPEPTSLLLLSLGISMAGLFRRRKHSI